jgi:hypothetical protein
MPAQGHDDQDMREDLSYPAGIRLWRTAVIALGLSLASATPAAADTINLAGVVPAKSGVRLVQRQTAVATDPSQPLRDFVLVSLVLQTNNRLGYKLSVLSDNARENGSTALVDSETGSSVPYSLKLGDQDIHFQDGAAVLENTPNNNKGNKSEDLKISTHGAASSGQYEERLTLVMSFN